MMPMPSPDTSTGGYRRETVCLLLAAVLLGAVVRFSGLAERGLAEDEVNKLQAVRQYQQGDFTGNAEHPMLLKSLILVSVTAADFWNRWGAGANGGGLVTDEVAVRLPNVLAGTLTVIPLFLVGAAFFSRRVGLLAAFLWAVGVHAVFINQMAKEDTLLVFFLLWGIYFHWRMKTTTDEAARRKRLFYLLSAACFGLLLASKYFPHFWGVTLLFFFLHRKFNPGLYPPDRYGKRELLLYVAVMGAVFLLANPMILHPAVMAHILSYTGQATVTHHGYVMFGHLFPNSITLTPFGGTPWYFYLLALIVKMPPLVLLAFVAGTALCVRRWREAGPMFVLLWLVFWLVPYSVTGVKFLRYILSLMPVVYLAAAFGTFAGAEWIAARLSRSGSPAYRWIPETALTALVVLVSLAALVAAHPFYALYVNGIGGGAERAAYYFPHDECYDLRLREAIADTLRQAPPGSVVVGETPAVFSYYLERSGRRDVRVANLSDARFSLPVTAPVFVFLQPGRIYYENMAFHSRLWNRERDLLSAPVAGRPMVRVFRLDGSEFGEIVANRDTVPSPVQASQDMYFLTAD